MPEKPDALRKTPSRSRDRNANARHQQAHRQQTKVLRTDLGRLKDELARACEAGRCASLTNHLPEDPVEWVPELVRRLADRKLIVCSARRKRKPKRERSEPDGR